MDYDDNDTNDTLNITPSFKSRSSKGRTKTTSKQQESDDIVSTPSADDNEEANSSAVVFKKSSTKNKSKSLLGGASTPSSASSSARKTKSQGTSSRSRLALSFDDDEDNNEEHTETHADDDKNEGDISVSEVRKLNKKKRLGGIGSSSLNKAAEKALSNSLSQASISSLADRVATTTSQAGPSYSRDYLDELKASNLVKAAPTHEARESALYAEDEEVSPEYADDNTLARCGASADTAVQDDDFTISSSGSILPTEGAIASAKARRETARRLGVDTVAPLSTGGSKSSDYISLQVGLPNATSKRESRLVREEDEIGEGEDDFSAFTGAEERIALGKKGRKDLENTRRKEMRALIEGDDAVDSEQNAALLPADDDDEEEREWELAQIRRGEQQRGLTAADDDHEPYRAAPIPEPTPLPTLIGTSKRLKAALAEYEISQIEADNLLAKSSAELSSLTSQESDLKQQVESTNLKYEFFLDFKAYINDIASFLEVKYPLLEKMELDNIAFQKERTKGIVGHRRDWDDADDVALFSGVGVKPLFELEKEQQQMKAGEQADKQMRVGEDNEEEVDDMGRSRRQDDTEPKSLARRTRRQERAKRRERHLASSSSTQVQSQAGGGSPQAAEEEEEEEGYDTDDTLLQSDSTDLITASQTLLESKTTEIFADVSNPEFQDPNQGIKLKFLDWKKRYPQDYREAFAGLSLVQAWEFWIRVEMCDWNPFGIKELQPALSLDSYTWHRSLTAYQEEAEALDHTSAASNGQHHQSPSEDEAVVNAAVATVLLPRLRKLTLEAYDPFSSHMTSKALHVVEEISYCLEVSNPRFQHIITTFLSIFQKAISAFQSLVTQAGHSIASPQIAIGMEAIQARQRFLHRQMKLLSNAVKWRRYSKGFLLPPGSGVGAGAPFEVCLVSELVLKCLLPVAEAAWDTGGREVAQKVLTFFPDDGSLPPGVARRLRGL